MSNYITDSNSYLALRNLSLYPGDPVTLCDMAPCIICVLWNSPQGESNNDDPQYPLYYETESITVLDIAPFVGFDMSGNVEDASPVWPEQHFKSIFYNHCGNFQINGSQRNDTVLHLNSQTYTNTDQTGNLFNLAEFMIHQFCRKRDINPTNLDPRTVMSVYRESNRYESLLDFRGYQRAMTWDEMIRFLTDNNYITKIEPESLSQGVDPRADCHVLLHIHLDIHSKLLKMNHRVVMPFVVRLENYFRTESNLRTAYDDRDSHPIVP